MRTDGFNYIIKDSRGTVRIVVAFNPKFTVRIWHKAPKKKTESIANEGVAIDSEIHAARLEAWKLIKPDFLDIIQMH